MGALTVMIRATSLGLAVFVPNALLWAGAVNEAVESIPHPSVSIALAIIGLASTGLGLYFNDRASARREKAAADERLELRLALAANTQITQTAATRADVAAETVQTLHNAVTEDRAVHADTNETAHTIERKV